MGASDDAELEMRPSFSREGLSREALEMQSAENPEKVSEQLCAMRCYEENLQNCAGGICYCMNSNRAQRYSTSFVDPAKNGF